PAIVATNACAARRSRRQVGDARCDLRLAGADPAAAQHAGVVVQHDGLPRRDRALRLVERDDQLARFAEARPARLWRVVVADLGAAGDPLAPAKAVGQQVDLIGEERTPQRLLARADSDAARR